MPEESKTRLSRATFFAIGMTALGRAIEIRGGQIGWGPGPYPAIGWLTLAIIMAALAAFCPKPLPITPRRFQFIVGLCLLVNFIQFATKTPDSLLGPYDFARFAPLSAGLIAMAFLCGCVLVAQGIQKMVVFVLLLLAFALVANWTFMNCPNPYIDVYNFQHDSAAALASGHNPYAITFPDIYGTDPRYYGPGAVAGGTLHFGYPYLPETLLAILPPTLLHFDFRYAQLAAMLASAILLVLISPTLEGFAAAALVLTTPTIFLILEKSWIEPFMLLTFAATVACAIRRPRLLPIALGLFLASKQYAPAAAVLFFVGKRSCRSSGIVLAQAILVAMIITLPLALWDFRAFWHSAVELQFSQPFRPDSLSYLAWMGKGFWSAQALVVVPFAALLIAMALLLWRRRSVTFSTAVAFAFLVFFAFNKQAFANYYFFVIGATACAIVEETHAIGDDMTRR